MASRGCRGSKAGLVRMVSRGFKASRVFKVRESRGLEVRRESRDGRESRELWGFKGLRD
jgi:hypothetical protein